MSLLMEALRKAEEAKSKAAKEEKDTSTQGDDTGPAEPSDAGPAIINPDPDEAETLASHASDSVLELVEMELQDEPGDDTQDADVEQVEFTTQPLDEQGASVDDDTGDNDDDALTLLQSSYFTRTKNSGSSFLDDDFDDLDDNDDSGDPADNDPATAAAADVPPLTDPSPEPSPDEEPAASAADNRETPLPSAPAGTEEADDRKTRERANRDSANALFLAKEDPRKRRLKKLAAVAAVALVVPLAGIVFWLFSSLDSGGGMQFNVPAGGNLANRSFSDTVAQPGTAPAETPAGEVTPAEDVAAASPESGSTATRLMALADNAEPEQPAPADATRQQPPVPEPRETAAARQDTPEPPVQEPARDTPAAPEPQAPRTAATASATGNTGPVRSDDNGLSFSRTDREPVLNPDLVAAYESYQQADYSTAARLYQQVLATEPNNTDALLHLASVQLKQNNPAMARNLYARLLELNPRDPLARAGILETVQGDPARQEAELKSLITAYPGTAQLSFALGNLYAKQNRWSEAQGAYFDALLAAKSNNTGPVSPDYAFNLAVSLERINQLPTALDYYREAEALSRTTRPGFDPALLNQRLTYLEQRLR